jgi:hypothetical protein
VSYVLTSVIHEAAPDYTDIEKQVSCYEWIEVQVISTVETSKKRSWNGVARALLNFLVTRLGLVRLAYFWIRAEPPQLNKERAGGQ